MGPSKGPVRVWPVIPALVLLCLMASGPALALEEGGTAVVRAGDALAFEINNTEGDDLWIEYEVEVLEGPPVNVWFVDQEGHDEFFDREVGTFSYYPAHTRKESTFANHSFSWDNADVFYVIIDNIGNDASGQNATVEYTITWETYTFGEFYLLMFMVLVIVIIIVVVVALVALVTVKKAQAEADERQAEAAREASDAWDDEESDRPRPPEPYPEWVVAASMQGSGDDDATGWDPSQDEPEDRF